MIKKLTYIIFGFILAWFVYIFTITANAEQNRPLKIWRENSNGRLNTYCLVDEKTNVNYIVIESYTDYYSRITSSVAICPRYNPDGSLYIN